jgi:hypothetical protein
MRQAKPPERTQTKHATDSWMANRLPRRDAMCFGRGRHMQVCHGAPRIRVPEDACHMLPARGPGHANRHGSHYAEKTLQRKSKIIQKYSLL